MINPQPTPRHFRGLALAVAVALVTAVAASADTAPPIPLPPPPPNKAPKIVNFKGVCHPMGVVVFSGKVEDEDPAGLVVTFAAAAVSVDGQTATTKTDGTFELTVKMKTDGSEAGTVEVTTVDKAGLASAPVRDNVTPRN